MDKITSAYDISIRILPIAAAILFLTVGSGLSQRSDYVRLALQENRPGIDISMLTLPNAQRNTVLLTATFRINYRLLSFKRTNAAPQNAEFFTAVSLDLELFKSPENDLKFNEEVSLIDLESAGSARWQDTVYAGNYEATTSDSKFAVGSMQVQLPPGYYTYVVKLTKNTNTERQISKTRNIHVLPHENSQNNEIILIDDIDESGNTVRLNLINRGDNVKYRNDFYAFIHLPNYEPQNSYRLKVNQIRIADEDTVQTGLMFEEALNEESFYTQVIPTIGETGDELFLNLQNDDSGHSYALVNIANQTLPNAAYRLRVIDNESEQIIAQKVYRSHWDDIPVSLLNLDIAIDMLRFIADEETIDRIDNGSYRDREESFSAFWKEKDPTPNTEFNELKAEYYRRIDYAFEHYTSQGTLGFETDRGKIYIVYGPPDNINRVYPADELTREIWTYDNRRFVFQATSGFGDFVLISPGNK